ncbi:copper chaperone PCu(A)C [soil metagenome]
MIITLFKRQAPACIALSLCLGLGSSAWAQVTVDRAWVRATVPNQSATGAFMRITADKDVELTGVRSPVAGLAEVHEMTMDNGIMRMRAVPRLQLKAGQSVELKSGGYHLMMLDLKQQIKQGQTVPLTLEFKAADASISKVEVKAIASFSPPAP